MITKEKAHQPNPTVIGISWWRNECAFLHRSLVELGVKSQGRIELDCESTSSPGSDLSPHPQPQSRSLFPSTAVLIRDLLVSPGSQAPPPSVAHVEESAMIAIGTKLCVA